MARRRLLEPLGAVLSRQGDVKAPESVWTSPISWPVWEAAVGPRIAGRAKPLRVDGTTLWILTANSTWSNELSLLAPAILARLAEEGVIVASLRFRVGDVSTPARVVRKAVARRAPPIAPLPRPVAEELGAISDLELREVITKAARQNLGWQSVVPHLRDAAKATPKRGRRPR